MLLGPWDSKMNGAGGGRAVPSAGSDLSIQSSSGPVSLLEKGQGLVFPRMQSGNQNLVR